MKKIVLILSLLIFGLGVKAQYPPSGLKQQLKQGLALGSKDSTAFTANDSLILTIDRNGKLLFRGNGSNAAWNVVQTGASSGTVTSIATNNGTGISGGTITSTGTLSIDTLNISTRLFRIKGTDSLAGLVALRVRIADTANMLSTYQRILANYSTTYALSNDVRDSIQTKLALRDTSGMLSGYARTGNVPSLTPYKLISDTLFNNGYTTRARLKQYGDSLAATKGNITGTLTNTGVAFSVSSTGITSNTTLTWDDAAKNLNIQGVVTANKAALDSIQSKSSAGGKVVSNGGTVVAEWGVGGGSNFDFHGFAGYDANRSSSYTARSFTDKRYVDSSLALKGSGTVTGTGTSGQATFFTGTSVISGDNSFFWDNTNKRLGLGTASPILQFHVFGLNAGMYLQRTGGVSFDPFIFLTSASGAFGGRVNGFADRKGLFFSGTGFNFSNRFDEWARFESNGQFIINDTADNGSLAKLQVKGLSTFMGTTLFNTTTDNGVDNVQVNGSLIATTLKATTATISGNQTIGGTLGVNGLFTQTKDDQVTQVTAVTGTSRIFNQYTNTSGSLYFGLNSSTGGGLASGGLAYASGFSTGTNTALQFGTNNIFRYTITGAGAHEFTGNTTIGGTLGVTGTSTLTGNVGIGQSPNGSFSLAVTSALPSYFTSTSNATSATYGGSVFLRQTNTVGNGNGISLNMNNASSAAAEYAYIGAIIETNTAGAESGAFIIAPTVSGTRTERFRIASTGAITASSSIQANSLRARQNTTSPMLIDVVNDQGFGAYTFMGTEGVTGGTTATGTTAYASIIGTTYNKPLQLIANGAVRLDIASTGAATFSSSVTATQYRLSSLNTAPSSATDTGTLGEIRIDASFIYICTATNTWKRVAIATW